MFSGIESCGENFKRVWRAERLATLSGDGCIHPRIHWLSDGTRGLGETCTRCSEHGPQLRQEAEDRLAPWLNLGWLTDWIATDTSEESADGAE